MGKHESHEVKDKREKKEVEKTIDFPESEEEEIEVGKKKHSIKKVAELDGSEASVSSESESDSSSSDEDSEDEEDDDAVSLSTTEILNSDPLYTILSQFFLTKDGKNIADVLDEINGKLSKFLKIR